jgi:hypothetical protein
MAVVFRGVAEGARKPLKMVTSMLIVEVEGDEVIREYDVPVRIVKDVESLIK